MVGKKLTALRRQRDQVQDALRAADADGKPLDVAANIDAIVGRLWRLGEELATAEPARRREVFRLFVDRIELRFDQVKQGKKTICPLQSGQIHLRTGEGTIFGSVSRGDWRSFEPSIAVFLEAALSQTAKTVVATRVMGLSG